MFKFKTNVVWDPEARSWGKIRACMMVACNYSLCCCTTKLCFAISSSLFFGESFYQRRICHRWKCSKPARVRFFLFSFFLFDTPFSQYFNLSFDASVEEKDSWAASTPQWRHLCLHQLLWRSCPLLSAGRRFSFSFCTYSCSFWLRSMKRVAIRYSVTGLFWAVLCHTAGAELTVREPVNNILSSTGVPRKCGVTCWLPC